MSTPRFLNPKPATLRIQKLLMTKHQKMPQPATVRGTPTSYHSAYNYTKPKKSEMHAPNSKTKQNLENENSSQASTILQPRNSKLHMSAEIHNQNHTRVVELHKTREKQIISETSSTASPHLGVQPTLTNLEKSKSLHHPKTWRKLNH